MIHKIADYDLLIILNRSDYKCQDNSVNLTKERFTIFLTLNVIVSK